MFVYLMIHDSIRYTIQKNKKSIYNTIDDLTTMLSNSSTDYLTKTLQF